MLSNFVLIEVSYEQAVITLAETTKTFSAIDSGSINTTLALHPVYGPMMVIENAAGRSAIAIQSERRNQFESVLNPTLTH
jgi:hypothetical protein